MGLPPVRLDVESLRSFSRREEGRAWATLPGEVVARLAREARIPPAEAEAQAVEHGLVPARYARNIGVLGTQGQARLLRSRVVVVGCGGLGGAAVELLARLGVGWLRVCDPDVFDETNLNRQLLATPRGLGKHKARAAARRARLVNPSTRVEAVVGRADRGTLPALLEGADIVVDALDNRDARLALQDAAAGAGIPLVHAAVGGTCFQVLAVFPGDRGLEAVYGREVGPAAGGGPAARGGAGRDGRGVLQGREGIESILGTPGPTPMVAAALQVLQVAAILTGTGTVLRDTLLVGDAASWQVAPVKL